MKAFFYTCSLVLTSLVAQAQSSGDGTGFLLGLRLGGNALLNKVEDFRVQGVTLKSSIAPSITGGLIVNYGFSPAFSIQPEILYTRLSQLSKASVSGEDIKIRTDVNTLEIPVLVKYSVGESTKFFVNAGPFMYYALNAQQKVTVGDQSQTDKIKFNSEDSRLEYGVTAGLGVSIPMGPGMLLAEGRFNYGLGASKIDSDFYENSKVATLSIGYLINLSGLGR